MKVEQLYEVFLKSTGISTDTRSIQKGNLFFALCGPNFNANTLAKEALEKGASAAVIDDKDYFISNDKTILVEKALQTLQALACHHRKQFTIPFIGITGTNGKTTTKELIHCVLSQQFKAYATSGNLNNHIGVPLTLLRMPADTEIAVIEMGANHPGDIKELCDIALPTHGIITNVGKAHLEGFGSFEGVKKTKAELYHSIREQGKAIFINSDNEHLKELAKEVNEQISYGKDENAYVQGKLIESTSFLSFNWRAKSSEWSSVHTQLIGNYNFENALCAVCIAHFFGVDPKKIKAGLEGYIPANNRSQVLQKGSNIIYLDAYNANPSSIAAAIENLSTLKAEGKIAILGDMFELGEYAASEHQAIGKLLASKNIEKAMLVGSEFFKNVIPTEQVTTYLTVEDLKTALSGNILEKKHILIKGSRGMKMEQLLDIF